MKKPPSYDNLEQRLQEVESHMNQETNRRNYERYQAVFLHLKGYTQGQIADVLNRTTMTVGTYIKRYRTGGLSGLTMSYSPGAPRRLTSEQEQRVRDMVLHQTPEDAGLKTEMNWTSPLVREWIKREFGISYTDRAVLKILHRLGFSHTRPTYTLEQADPAKQQAFRETFDTYKKTRKWRD